MKIFISGFPGCGKTTLMMLLLEELKKQRKKVAGILTREIRTKKGREGFFIEDITTEKKLIIASTKLKEGPKVSKYHVNVDAIDLITKLAEKNFENAEIILIDEIGKMELYSAAFHEMIKKVLNSSKIVIATLHRNYVNDYKKYGVLIWLEKEKIGETMKKILDLIK